MVKHAEPMFICPFCKEQKEVDEAMPGDLISSSLATLIEQAHPEWDAEHSVCFDCLDRLRSQYIQTLLDDQQKQLFNMDTMVLSKLREYKSHVKRLSDQMVELPTFGERLADRISEFGGSWAFIMLFFFVLVLWTLINSGLLLIHPFDPYPYIFLNLLLSMLAAIQAPVIMMSQNRMETIDRKRAEYDYRVNLKSELEVRLLHIKLDQFMTHHWQRLLEIQQIQVDLMQELHDHIKHA